MKRVWLLLMCVSAALLLTACHVDHDPWPVDGAVPVVTAAVEDVPAAAVITGAPTQAPTAVPAATEAPAAVPYVTMAPTEVPGGSEEPGING